MPPLSRRTLFGTAAGIAAAATTGADAQTVGEPRALLGTVADGRVTLPPLHAATEAEDSVPNGEPVARRLGVCVVGLGHLALTQILPGFGQAKDVRVTALVSGEPAKARAVAAQYGVPETGIYDYGNFDRIKDNPAIDIVYIVLPNAMHLEYTVRGGAGRQARAVREAHGHERRRRPAHGGCLQGREPQADDRLPLPVRAAPPRADRRGPQRPSMAKPGSSRPSTARTTCRTGSGGRSRPWRGAARCPMWGCIA